MRLHPALFLLTLGCGPAATAAAPQVSPSTTAPDLPWDTAFADRSGDRPLHFVAEYHDSKNITHHLEEWRSGLDHLRRRTDDRIDLHADSISSPHPVAGQPRDYLWQILDLGKKIDHRVSTPGLLRAGMLYSFWSMAHVLTRPPGTFHLTALQDVPALHLAGVTCTWYLLSPAGGAKQRICWSPALAIPLRIEGEKRDGSYSTAFLIQSLDRNPIPASTFTVNSAGFQIRNVDELAFDD